MTDCTTLLIPKDTLLQVYTRFILNLPPDHKEECRKNFVRLFFEVERAHWFYLDHFIDDPSVGGIDMYGFTEQLFREFPSIVPPGVDWREKYSEWRRYRGQTETGGAVILDEYFEMVLLVQGFYGNRWNFPGGKVNENESLTECAAREVLEETGLDIECRIIPSLYIDRIINGTLRRVFLIENMPRVSRLQPCTRNEIEAITWFTLNDLPTNIKDTRTLEKFNLRPNNFYLIVPYVSQLQDYIRLRRSGLSTSDALEESSRLHLLKSSLPVPDEEIQMPTNAIHTPKQSRSRKPIKQRNRDGSSSTPKKHVAKQKRAKSSSLPVNRKTTNQLDVDTDLVLLDVRSPSSNPISKVDFSSSYWNNVRLRGDTLLDLLTNP